MADNAEHLPASTPDRWAGLRDEERMTLLWLSRLTEEERSALLGAIHDRLFWMRVGKKVKGFSGVIVTISAVIMALTLISERGLKWLGALAK